MDGNRRWAKENNLPTLAGHTKVAMHVVDELVEHAAKIGIKYITFWAWSTENWKRDENEVKGIMQLFQKAMETKGKALHEKGVRVKFIGDISKLSDKLQTTLLTLTELTKNNNVITATIAINYGGRDEIVRAINKAISYQSSDIRKSESGKLTVENFSRFLDTSDLPDPDIIVRTGGEKRLSGFLIWQSEYTELFFENWYMPEFNSKKLDEICEEFNSRQRRFGK